MEKRRQALREAKGELSPQDVLAGKEATSKQSPAKIQQLEWELEQPIDPQELAVATERKLGEIHSSGRKHMAEQWKAHKVKDDAEGWRTAMEFHFPSGGGR
jgi:hypothetical protein